MMTFAPTVTPYEEHREYVLRVLAWRSPWLDPSDREAILHDAYTLFLEKQHDGTLDVRSMRPPQVRAYLVQTALHKAMDEGKRAGRRRSVPLDGAGESDVAAPDVSLDEALAARFEAARVRELVGELPPRQQMVIALRFFSEQTPAEIQRRLGMSERTYRRLLERAVRALAERYALVAEGSYCEARRSVIAAWLADMATPAQADSARAHLASCPGCARWAAERRDSLRLAGTLSARHAA